ncbi:hypothetical protein D9615_000753 [Tricholomella constricta]|uniref:Uncharacterized protein n=1 Tax=Tricholomella constricta TaxID=117010 RepID=A0A8H5MBL2_9AGAR|nr:hypothetical protein D9615_000753 [Tricholomella constricta]
MASNLPRRTHRKRVSALRLSSDTTSTLPEYITVGGWHREDDDLSDRPPDYPDSAEEADEDTDTSAASLYVPPPLPNSAPATSARRQRRLISHRRRHSAATNDPYLDSLLARSVHALEMSNTLLQSSMSTQTSLSTIFAVDSPADEVLETSARGLSMRIQGQGRDTQAKWADDLAEISREVEGLFGEDEEAASSSSKIEPSLSSSLPSSSPPPQLYRQRRRPSLLDLRGTSEPNKPYLQLSYQDRSALVSPPPRALTQYVASTSDPDAITLPSTLGLRVPSSSHSATDRRPHEASAPSLHAPLSSPQLMDRLLEPSTPAYNMLASFVNRASSSGSSTPSSSLITSPLPSFLSTSRRSSRNTSTSTERSDRPTRSSPLSKKSKLPESSRTDTHAADRASRSLTPKQILTSLPHRPMTPPTEESSSCSSDSCPAKRTVLSLRKILDEQPPPAPPERPPPPAFLLPRTPAPVAEAGTSTATASISRLFTKAKHSSSTRPPSPPRQSAMKQQQQQHASSSSSSPGGGSGGGTPSPSPTVLSIPDLLGVAGNSGAGGLSTPSSGRSTPKRISFAELPESYAESRPGGSSARFRDKQGRRSKGRGKGKGKEKEEAGGGWWSGWLVSTSPVGTGAFGSRHEERMEDRLSRTWGGRMAGAGAGAGFGSGLDEWAM